jgi:beta-lactamase regulating signal transducer with metallopeptidase domain
MQELITYLLKANGLLIAFFLAYHLLLRKETFFTSNRWFLLFGMIASTLLPLLFFKKIVYVERPKISINDLIILSNHSKAIPIKSIAPTIETIDWLQVVAFGYVFMVLLLLVKAIVNIYSISRLLKNKTVLKENNFSFIDLEKDIAPFSFFNFIVFNSSLYSQNELDSILLHEKVHCSQKHSLDVLVVNLFTIFFWINPIVWFYKKAVIQNLEFIADSKAIQHIADKKAYQKTLLKVVSNQNFIPITNHFYQSLIKKRIVMLNKIQSHKRNSWKYSAVIPALFAFVFLFQIKVVAQEKAVSAIAVGYTTDKNATDEEMKNDTKMAKEQLGIDYKFSNVKRNDKGEIIAIKIEYKTKEGKSGKIVLDSDNPIETIYFNADGDKVGFSKNGFYNSQHNTLAASYDEAINIIALNKDKETNAVAIPNNNEVSFVTKNEKNEDVVVIRQGDFTGIKVPGEPTLNLNTKPIIVIDGSIVEGDTDKIINLINPDNIESMNVIKGENAIKNYGDKGKNGVIEIYAKVKTKSTDTPDSITDSDYLSIVLNSSEPDAGWYSLSNYFKKQNIITDISNIKRNKENKIIAITIVMKSNDGRVQKLNIERNTPIKSIEIFVDKTKNKNWNFGVKELDLEYKSEIDSNRKNEIQSRKDAIQARKDAVQARKDAVQAKALQDSGKKKFKLKGEFKFSGGDGIPIGAINVPKGSVVVTAGGRKLVGGVDYTVNYQAGRVQILDPALSASNTPIQVSVENKSTFGN